VEDKLRDLARSSTENARQHADFPRVASGTNLAAAATRESNMRTSIIAALAVFALILSSLVSGTSAFADVFMQARCPQHRVEWRGPKRSGHNAFRDADAHNRAHRGHEARVVMVDHEEPAPTQTSQASIEPTTKMQ
jgi:hypothetical protein